MNAKFRRVVGSAIVTAVVLGTLPVPALAAQGGRESRVDHSAPAPDKSSPVLTSKPPSAPPLRPAGSSAFSPTQKVEALRLPAATGGSVRPPLDRVLVDETAPGTIWVRGEAYKARFDASGATFIPYLGPHAERNRSLSLSLRDVRGAEVGFSAKPSAPRLEGTSVTFARGGVLERYELRPEGIEQVFVLSRARRLQGDIRLRIDVTTDLAFAGASDGMRFQAGALGGVRYGEATAIDAAGARVPAATAFEGGILEIRVPAEFAESAAYPLTIDPVISSFAVDASGYDNFAADIAFDSGSGLYVIAYEETYSATDHDILCSSFTSGGVPAFGAYQDFTASDARAPSVANNGAAGVNLVVFEFGAPGAKNLQGRLVTPAGTNVAAAFPVAALANDDLRPDVGGDPYPVAPTLFLVTWENAFSLADHDIWAVTVDTAGVPGAPFAVDHSTAYDLNPRMTSSNGFPGNWGIVWEREFSPTDHDVYMAVVEFDGDILVPSTPVDLSFQHDTFPDVGGDGLRFLAVYEGDYGTDHDVMGLRVDLFGTGLLIPGGPVDLSILEPGVPSLEDQRSPAVDADGCRFAYVYAESFAGSLTDYDIQAASVMGDATLTWVEGHETVSANVTLEGSPAIVSEAGAGGSPVAFGIAWQDEFSPTDHDIFGARYDGSSPGSVSPFPSACGPAPTLGFAGSPVTGGFVSFSLTGFVGFPFLWAGLPTAVPLCPPAPCLLGASFDIVFAGAAFGAAIPCDSSLIGATAAVQGADVFAPGGCVVPFPFVVTNTLDVTIG
jgi:hypothetical protein